MEKTSSEGALLGMVFPGTCHRSLRGGPFLQRSGLERPSPCSIMGRAGCHLPALSHHFLEKTGVTYRRTLDIAHGFPQARKTAKKGIGEDIPVLDQDLAKSWVCFQEKSVDIQSTSTLRNAFFRVQTHKAFWMILNCMQRCPLENSHRPTPQLVVVGSKLHGKICAQNLFMLAMRRIQHAPPGGGEIGRRTTFPSAPTPVASRIISS